MPLTSPPVPWAAKIPSGLALGPAGLAAADGASTANRMYLVPVIVTAQQTFSDIGISACAGATAGKLVRFGVYRPNFSDPLTGVLVADLGSDTLPVSTPSDNNPGVPVTLAPGLYFLACVFEEAGTMRRVSNSTMATECQYPSTGTARAGFAQVLGAFPASMPATYTVGEYYDWAPCLQLRA